MSKRKGSASAWFPVPRTFPIPQAVFKPLYCYLAFLFCAFPACSIRDTSMKSLKWDPEQNLYGYKWTHTLGWLSNPDFPCSVTKNLHQQLGQASRPVLKAAQRIPLLITCIELHVIAFRFWTQDSLHLWEAESSVAFLCTEKIYLKPIHTF